jgi:hypothetical protein
LGHFEKVIWIPVEPHFTPRESKIHTEFDLRKTLPSRAPPVLS